MVNFAITPELRIGVCLWPYSFWFEGDFSFISWVYHFVWSVYIKKRFHVHQDFSNINL
jgi:hypothetical protein